MSPKLESFPSPESQEIVGQEHEYIDKLTKERAVLKGLLEELDAVIATKQETGQMPEGTVELTERIQSAITETNETLQQKPEST